MTMTITNPVPYKQPLLNYPTGLRRLRAALGDAFNTSVPIICIGDSVTFGQGADNINATNAIDYAWGYPAQLRHLFSKIYGAPGEGFIGPAISSAQPDTRITSSGTTTSNTLGPFGYAYNIAATQTVTLAVPATDQQGNAVQSVDIILWNSTGNQPPTWSFNSGASTGTCASGGAGSPDFYYNGANVPTAGVAANLVVTGPGSAQCFLIGFVLHSASTTGVPVHRLGLCGGTTGMLTGISNGLTSTQQGRVWRSYYQWASRIDASCGTTNTSTTVTDTSATATDVGLPVYGAGIPQGTAVSSVTPATSFVISKAATATGTVSLTIGTPGLIILPWGINDQAFEGGGGTSAQNGITPTLFSSYLQSIITKFTTDGWCCLLVGEPRNPNYAANSSPDVEDTYYAQMNYLASINDHVSYLDIGASWGPQAASHTTDINLQLPGSVHPSRRGYGDIARILYQAIMGNYPSGITNTVGG